MISVVVKIGDDLDQYRSIRQQLALGKKLSNRLGPRFDINVDAEEMSDGSHRLWRSTTELEIDADLWRDENDPDDETERDIEIAVMAAMSDL